MNHFQASINKFSNTNEIIFAYLSFLRISGWGVECTPERASYRRCICRHSRKMSTAGKI